jgi:CO dehydrogenase/acetyl-CoA synthase alpha subunit
MMETCELVCRYCLDVVAVMEKCKDGVFRSIEEFLHECKGR